MGIDKSLSDEYPSVIINGTQYHYGREPEDGQYLVENAHVAKDYWCFDKKEDLVAFLVNLPESAEQNRLSELYPDWSEVTPEQRVAYMEEDRAMLRAKAEEKIRAGTAQEFCMDLEGEHGPYEPQRTKESSLEPPIARVERQLRTLERDLAGPWNDAGKLISLEGQIDWAGVSENDKEAVLSRHVDFTKVTPEQFNFVYRSLAEAMFDPPDDTVARRLFDQTRAGTAQDFNMDLDGRDGSRSRVWHLDRDRTAGRADVTFPDDYRPVAEVESTGLEEVRLLTSDLTKDWREHPEVRILDPPNRSTEADDVVELPDGRLFMWRANEWTFVGTWEPSRELNGPPAPEPQPRERAGGPDIER